jgi:hypothetical protein
LMHYIYVQRWRRHSQCPYCDPSSIWLVTAFPLNLCKPAIRPSQNQPLSIQSCWGRSQTTKKESIRSARRNEMTIAIWPVSIRKVRDV